MVRAAVPVELEMVSGVVLKSSSDPRVMLELTSVNAVGL